MVAIPVGMAVAGSFDTSRTRALTREVDELRVQQIDWQLDRER